MSGASAMAAFELATASTGTGIIPPRHRQLSLKLSILPGYGNHSIGRGAAGSQFPGHEFHLRSNVPEERLVALTTVVESWFTTWAMPDTVLGATSVAGEKHGTFLTVSWQSIPLGQTELPLLRGPGQHSQVSLTYVA